MTIGKKMLAIQAELSAVGIAKDQRNDQQRYNYRGIDQLLNTLSGLFVKHEVMVLPNMLSVEVDITPSGKQRIARVLMRYEFVDLPERDKDFGQSQPLKFEVYGEGADSGDKAIQKAMTAAYKYLMIQLFAIPIVGNDDPDAHSSPDQDDQAGEPLDGKLAAALKEKLADITKQFNLEKPTEAEFCRWLTGDADCDDFSKLPGDQFTRAESALSAIAAKHNTESQEGESE